MGAAEAGFGKAFAVVQRAPYRVVVAHFQRQLGATALGGGAGHGLQQAAAEALTACGGQHRQIMQIAHRRRVEAGKAQHAQRVADRLAALLRDQREQAGMSAQCLRQLLLAFWRQSLATPHRIAGVGIGQPCQQQAVAGVGKVGRTQLKCAHGAACCWLAGAGRYSGPLKPQAVTTVATRTNISAVRIRNPVAMAKSQSNRREPPTPSHAANL
ncbi:hypothetical protein D3C78_1250050 [compost metagenome]